MLLLLAAGMGMIVSGLLWTQVQKPTFSILLTTAAGDVTAHSHRDEIFILVRVEVNATLPILEFVSIKAFSSLEVVGVLVSPVDLSAYEKFGLVVEARLWQMGVRRERNYKEMENL
jgi:hypothetical protein